MKTNNGSNCGCSGNSTKNFIALSCSGASDLGELSDHVTRKIRKEMPNTSMNCLAKLGFNEPALMESISKEEALVVDGCPIDCGKKIMEKNGISNFRHFRLTDFGYVKGQTPVSEELANEVAKRIINEI